jgi:TonB-linked SusC/RagA family outer membrane protein
MKHTLNLFCLLVLLTVSIQSQAQSISISGIVTDENRISLPGVNVHIKGTALGTVTDVDGKFELLAPPNGIVQFSYIGYESVESRITNVPLSIVMKEKSTEIDEVVVTALGIKREKKSLSYSVTELKEDAFLVKESNLAAGLVGKVAGVNVVRPTSGAMGSSRITIRGNGSFESNQPLYIVDGVPIDNSNYGQPGLWGGTDGGDGISSLNSDDIESMTILKGGTAAALYGSRAANGAIVITTKKGAKGKPAVEWNSSFTFDTPIVRTDDFQYEYGHGIFGKAPESLATIDMIGPSAWGGKLDGSNIMQFDGVTRPYVAAGKHNFARFYDEAWSLSNNLSVSSGNETMQYRISLGDQRYDDLFPNSKMSRNNISLNLTSELTNKLSLQASVMYLRERVKNRQMLNDYSSNGNVLLWILPPSIDIRSLSPAVDANGDELVLGSVSIWLANPYFIAYKRRQEDAKDRTIGSLQLQYNFNNRWYLRGRAGGDMIFRRSESTTPKGTAYQKDGGISSNFIFNGEFNAEAILGYKSTIGEKWTVNAFTGWNSMAAWYESLSASGSRFIQPDFDIIGNTETTSGGQYKSENYINSLFGQAEMSFNNLLFLTFTGRNDWFSALSLKGKTTPNHIFYPSVGASFLLHEAMHLPSWIYFMKLRSSWAQSGGAVSPYSLALTYRYNEAINGYPTGSINTGTVPDLNLKPLTSTSYELGADIRFLNNRLGIDATYYVRNTNDDIVTARISNTSGYGSVLINAGQINNRGVELLLTATVLQIQKFRWNTSLNFSYNKSEIKRITDKIDSFVMATARAGAANDQGSPAYIYQEVGEPYGIIKGYSYKRDNGEIVFDNDGYPVKGELKKLGEGVHPYTAGFGNRFEYRGFSLNLLIDGKFGGSVFSGTNNMAYYFGIHKNTLEGREGGVVGKGVTLGGTPNKKVVPAMEYYMTLSDRITEEFVYDASFVKLREIAVGYTFPQSLIRKAGLSAVTVSLIGRNLLLLYSKVPMVDPESTFTNGNGQGLEQFGLPATRSWGINLNVKF